MLTWAVQGEFCEASSKKLGSWLEAILSGHWNNGPFRHLHFNPAWPAINFIHRFCQTPSWGQSIKVKPECLNWNFHFGHWGIQDRIMENTIYNVSSHPLYCIQAEQKKKPSGLHVRFTQSFGGSWIGYRSSLPNVHSRCCVIFVGFVVAVLAVFVFSCFVFSMNGPIISTPWNYNVPTIALLGNRVAGTTSTGLIKVAAREFKNK